MMGASERQSLVAKVGEWAEKRVTAIWTNLQTNHLWQRMLKNTLATTIAVILALIPAVVAVFGKAAYLGPITTVFGHPGRRFGAMVMNFSFNVPFLSEHSPNCCFQLLAFFSGKMAYFSTGRSPRVGRHGHLAGHRMDEFGNVFGEPCF
jgi:hypothetical protein